MQPQHQVQVQAGVGGEGGAGEEVRADTVDEDEEEEAELGDIETEEERQAHEYLAGGGVGRRLLMAEVTQEVVDLVVGLVVAAQRDQPQRIRTDAAIVEAGRHDRNVVNAARQAGVDRTYIYRLIRKHEL